MSRRDDDFRQEIEAHIALETDRLVGEGMSPADARDAAVRKFGNVTSARERFYESRRVMWIDHLRRDVRYALRSFARSPLFAITAVLSIAIGIGADTTVFTVANGLLLRSPAGVADPGRLVDISRTDEDRFGINEISFLNYLDIRERSTTLEDVYGYDVFPEPMSLADTTRAERIFGHAVTPNYFTVLGILPAAGGFLQADATVVLSHEFWTRRFAQDPAVIGKTMSLNSRPFTIAGVAAAGFRGTSLLATDLWLPVDTTPFDGSFLTRRELGWALLRARLRPGVSVSQAAAELDTIGRALEQEHPAENRGHGLRLAAASFIPGNLALPMAGVLALLMVFVSLVLAIACANLAGVLLARATVRRREIAVRLAIGAGRARLVRQLVTETLVLFAIGGSVGLLLARALTSLVLSMLPMLPVPVDLSLGLDGRVLAFTAGLTLVASLLCGLVPALQASKADVVSALKDETQGGFGRLRLRNAFVVGQLALSLVLVVGAGLFARALQRETSFDPGFHPVGVELASIDVSLAGYTQTTGPRFFDELLDRLRAVPGVQDATIAAGVGGGRLRFGSLTHPGVEPRRGGQRLEADWNVVEPGFFSTLGIPIVAGRDFSAADRAGAEHAVIVSEEAARRFWPGQNAIGQYLLQHLAEFRIGQNNDPKTLRVIGVARNVRAHFRETARPQVYLALQQHFVPRVTIAARAADGRRLAAEVRAAVAALNPNLPILTAQTLEEALVLNLLPQRLAASLSAALGLVGLLLAAIGVYGVTAYAVTHRTREIGIRIALGARRADVMRLILRLGMALVFIGSSIGLILASAVSLVLMRVFAGFPRMDAAAVAAAVALFAATGLVACYVPVRRATSIDAMEALRYE